MFHQEASVGHRESARGAPSEILICWSSQTLSSSILSSLSSIILQPTWPIRELQTDFNRRKSRATPPSSISIGNDDKTRLPGRTVAGARTLQWVHAAPTTPTETLWIGVATQNEQDENAELRQRHRRAAPGRGQETVQCIRGRPNPIRKGTTTQAELLVEQGRFMHLRADGL